MRALVIILLVAILASLFSGLVFIYRERGQATTRVAVALTLRVAFSLALFALLMLGYYFGLIGDRL